MQKVILNPADGGQMAAYVSAPKTSGKAGIIVLQEAFGVNEHIKDLTRRFASQGYLAIAPELYHRTAPEGFTVGYTEFDKLGAHFGAVTTESMQNDVQASFDWLRGQGCEAVAAIGYCMGGRVAFVANAKVPLSCAISYYGGRIAPSNLGLADKQRSPILFFWGGLDKHIPPEQVHSINEALTQAGKKFTCVQISDADHGFSCDERPAYNPVATREAWAHTLQFLADHNVAR